MKSKIDKINKNCFCNNVTEYSFHLEISRPPDLVLGEMGVLKLISVSQKVKWSLYLHQWQGVWTHQNIRR